MDSKNFIEIFIKQKHSKLDLMKPGQADVK